MQISHPGRQCARISNNRPVAPSAVQLRILANFARPRALDGDEVTALVAAYARVAGTARDAGFTGVQIHGAHGYLISQFLSPHTNQRTDAWGGSLANRARFLLEIVRATRARVGPAFPVGVKLNSADFQQGGFTLEESCQVAAWLAEEGVDLLEISGGTYEQPRLLGLKGDPHAAAEPKRESTRRREAYFLEYAQAIRAAAKLPLVVTGGMRDPDFMQEALAQGQLDVVGLARPLCVNPDFAAQLVAGEASPAPRYEDELRLGNGWLRPSSPIGAIRILNTQGGAAWYYRQILRLADGLAPDPGLPFGKALRDHFVDEYRIGLQRRRQVAL
jgi:2,4-dienoyl-CoA reductase-like NADH-dependent reductase (Old Yellow Enzyme family)